jgi:hypothetical protein
LKNKSAFLLGLLILFMSVESKALVFGIRFSDLNARTLPTEITGETGTKERFGVYLGSKQKKGVILVGADYDRFKREAGDSLLYARRLTLNIGYRYQLLTAQKATAMKFAPFVAAHYFKSFSQVKADSGLIPPAQVKYLKDLANDSGVWLSAGAEYSFAPVFSLGCEGGIRYSKVSSSALGYKVKKSEYNSFVALLLSFYMQ